MKTLVFVCLAVGAPLFGAEAPSVTEIVKRSVAANEANWKAAPNYTFIERDVESKKDKPATTKTWEVYLLDGSNYNKLIAVNDQPLPAEQAAQEEQKFRAEVERREHETPAQRDKRVQKYQKERQQDNAMMTEMAVAFQFKLAGEEKLAGRDVWVLDATPKPDFVPQDRAAKVLRGMRGRMWIDKATFQWVKVRGEVVRPVAFYGFLAKVGPGTSFTLENEPVGPKLWLPKHLSIKVSASALGFINEDSTDDETYGPYKPQPDLIAKK